MSADEHCDIAIVGAGAAGLTAAIAAAEIASRSAGGVPAAARIVLLDGASRLGAKILVSGGGRCNVTNASVTAEDFNGPRNLVRKILAAFDSRATVRWFELLGVRLRAEEGGKLFPASNRARDVLDALVERAHALGIEVRVRHRVHELRRESDLSHGASHPSRLSVVHERGSLAARRVILAPGGSSLPRSGSDGGGFRIAAAIGHTVHTPAPALVPLVLSRGMFHTDLAGLSLPAEVTVRRDGRVVDRRRGDLLWTHFGVSGPVVLDASRHWTVARANGRTAEVRLCFLPGEGFGEIESVLIKAASTGGRRSCRRVLAERVPARLAAALTENAGIDPALPIGELKRDDRRRLVHALVDFRLPVERDRGWNHAETTAGGVPLEEIDPSTMASRRVPGLHLAGEILDCDGRIGGFNFQWAWSTGWIAGSGASSSL